MLIFLYLVILTRMKSTNMKESGLSIQVVWLEHTGKVELRLLNDSLQQTQHWNMMKIQLYQPRFSVFETEKLLLLRKFIIFLWQEQAEFAKQCETDFRILFSLLFSQYHNSRSYSKFYSSRYSGFESCNICLWIKRRSSWCVKKWIL